MTFPQVVPTIASLYYCRLKDDTGDTIAIFDDWQSLRIKRQINGICDYVFRIGGTDSRRDLFEVNYRFEVWRSVPDCGLDYYKEFEGLHETQRRAVDSSGNRTFTSEGIGLNGLLVRRVIAYPNGTVMAEKDAPAETAMKEYVIENCGNGATVLGGRYFDCSGAIYGTPGDMANFNVALDLSRGGLWQGSRGFHNLMDVLKDISESKLVDFEVHSLNETEVEFEVYPDQIGEDRTRTNIDPVTGLNGAGNSPVVFSVENGTVMSIEYVNDHRAESNVAVVTGTGDGATQDAVSVFDNLRIDEDRWNQREVNRPGGGNEFCYQWEDLGYEVLAENQPVNLVNFVPLQQASQLYGLHYSLGDRVTAIMDGITSHQRLMEVEIIVEAGGNEQINLTFAQMRV